MRRSQGRDHLPQLEEFFDRGLIDGVLGLVKTGKEATVYCCRGGPAAGVDLVAAKVYRGRQFRFKDDSVYVEARIREMGLSGSALRAFRKRTSRQGRLVRDAVWRHREYETLELLYEAGADVPKPLSAANDVVLMEYIGDEDGAASQLNRLRIGEAEAPELFQRLIDNVELWLGCNRVHGDLSPHNILYWRGAIKVIDFPQATDPRFNRSARELLARDIANVCRYFEAYGVESDAGGIADELWRRFTYAEL
jgi:RIO kinase 1